MRDMAMFMGVFVVGYLLTMGLFYVVLSLFPKPSNRRKNAIMKVSGDAVMKVSVNPRKRNEGIQGIDKPAKMKIANG